MENQEFNPPPVQSSPTPKLVYILIVVLVLVFGGIGGYLLVTKKTSAPAPTIAPKITTKYPTATTSDETANWRTFTNSVYHYSIAAPRDFTLNLCNDCNPPEVNFSLQNNSKTITIGASYAAQWSLIANMSSKPTPVKNLKVVIQGKRYDPEEYFDNDNERYIFKIDDVESSSRSSQISLSGDYKSLNDATLVSDILSTFKFLPIAGSTSSPQAVADETEGWKTYTNSRLGFNFKYPNTWDPTIEENFSSGMTEIALSPYLNISVNFVGGWMGKNVKEEIVNIDGVEGVVSLWLNCSSNDAKEWEACNSQLSLNKYDTAVLRAQFNKGQDKWLVTSRLWKKGEKDENVEFNNFKQILSTFRFD